MFSLSKIKAKFKTRTITQRWITNVLSIVVLVFLITFILLSSMIKSAYYNAIDGYLAQQTNAAVKNYFELYLDDKTTFTECATAFIENYTTNSKAVVWLIDSSGHVIMSSSGFSVPNEKLIDYEKAIVSDELSASWTGKLSTGEHVMAHTEIVSNKNPSQSGAVRYISSLENVNKQIVSIIVAIFLVLLVFLAVVVIFNFLFIRSITIPVKKLSTAASRIAQGDFSFLIKKENDDEIGGLVDSINNMAVDISTADTMKNDFISTVSHELRTPLTSIKGWGETLLVDPLIDPQMTHRGLQVIINESGRLAGFVEELLDFSRIENGKMSLRFDKIDILAELDETIFVFKERAMREGIEIQYTAPDLPAPALADANRIKQIFVNILDNALKYNSEGGRVFVSAELEKEKIIIIVADNGCGISKQDLPHITEKFYKANISVKGSGIGLAVANEIILLHHGTLDIESVEGEGTTVTISFPLINMANERNQTSNE